MSTVFLMGAGASFGSGPCTPRNPPVGAGFFKEFSAAGGVAATVSEDLEKLFEEDFEKAMDRFFEERNTDVTAFLREMAEYFCQFEPLDGNYYIELLKILKGDNKKATFVTTNYDLLIELSVIQFGLLISYCGLPVSKNNIPILKIHGSCNFLPDLGGGGFSGIGFDISNSNGGSILDAKIKIASSTKEIIDFCKREDSIAPALAMYSPDKRVLYCKSFIEEQQSQWKEAINKASRIYVVGLRVHPVDDHIWGVLADAKADLYYVGSGTKSITDWSELNHKSNVYHIADTFEKALPVIAKHLKSKWKPK